MKKCILLICVTLLAVACATHAGPIAAGASAAIMALDQMLASGAIDANQYVALKGGFDVIDGVKHTVEALNGARWTPGEMVGAGSAALAAVAAAMHGAKVGAVKQVRAERGPPTQKVG